MPSRDVIAKNGDRFVAVGYGADGRRNFVLLLPGPDGRPSDDTFARIYDDAGEWHGTLVAGPRRAAVGPFANADAAADAVVALYDQARPVS